MTNIDQIKIICEEIFQTSASSHDWDHTLRVHKLCQHIGKIENADMEVLEIAALLHDIGREYQDKNKGKICHAEIGAQTANSLLEAFDLSKEKKENIIHCIKTHRYRNNNTPQTLEAKILFDADKLDSIGAIGIGRIFLFAGEHGGKLHDTEVNTDPTAEYTKDDTAYREYIVKLQYIKDKIITNEAQKIAQKRHDFMKLFFKTLNKEINHTN